MARQSPTVLVTCSDCKTSIAEEPSTAPEVRQPCPVCGSKTRLFKVHIEDKIEVHSTLRMEGHEAGNNRPFLVAKFGDDLYRKTGEWNHVEQIVDRRNNRYRKLVLDLRTEIVFRDVNEPLTDHQGYGSAKKPKNPK